jgi:hypothetical protein
MRNQYSGTCYKCGTLVEPDDGYFERHKHGWRVQHVRCKDSESSFTSFAEAVGAEEVENQ